MPDVSGVHRAAPAKAVAHAEMWASESVRGDAAFWGDVTTHAPAVITSPERPRRYDTIRNV